MRTSVSNKTAFVLRKCELIHLDNNGNLAKKLTFAINLTWLFCQGGADLRKTSYWNLKTFKNKKVSNSEEIFQLVRKLTATRTVQIICYIFWTIVPFCHFVNFHLFNVWTSLSRFEDLPLPCTCFDEIRFRCVCLFSLW